MKRPEAGPANVAVGFPDEVWMKRYPLISEYLSSSAYDDGSARDPSTLVLKCQDGRVLAALNDVDMRRSLYVVGEDVSKALASLERHLGTPGADWRSWAGAKGKRK